MKLVINSRKLNRKIIFTCHDYIYVNLNDQPGTLGNQICKNGALAGATLYYSGDNYDRFKRICKNWYRQFLNSDWSENYS